MAMINRYDIVNLFKDYAEDHGWLFLYGGTEYASAMNAHQSIAVDQLVLAMEWRVRPQVGTELGAVETVQHNCTFMLGRKFEASTMAQLDETMQQKHDRRLAYLCETLVDMIEDVACDNLLSVTFGDGFPLPNMWANNIDFFSFSVTLTD